jgi:alpha-ketoglutarate-dependent 2,4-dichlorophenoxyacetate dioxygenase
MAITITPVTDSFAAEVGDLDLNVPLTDYEFALVDDAFNKYSVLVFCGQENLTEQGQIDFSARFGPLETTVQVLRKDARLRLRPEFADVSNLNQDHDLLHEKSRRRAYNVGNQLWHTDSSFKRIPARASLLHASAIPPIGGHTEFADLRAAYDALPADTKARIEGLVAEHCILTSRAKTGYTGFDENEVAKQPPVPQVMVRTHAGSKRRTLYLASHAGRILGMEDDEARALLAELIDFATQRQFVYTHRWRGGDLVMWDDRCTMHRGRPFDDLRYRRDMRRTTVSDEIPTCEREGIRLNSIAAE